MSPFEALAHPLAAALALALFHFLWQGLVIAAVLIGAVELFGIRRPQARYLCSLAALVLMAACPLVTIVASGAVGNALRGVPSTRTDVTRVIESTHPPIRNPQSAIRNYSALRTPRSALVAAQPYVLTVWLAGVLYFGTRLLMGVIGVERLRRDRLPLPRELAERVEQLGRRHGLRTRSMVFLSRRVGEAIAVGVARPLVLVPLAWVTEMPLSMLEAVIAHELAHLQRRDLWIVLLERIVESLLFYHPAVWWLTGRLRAERELCCDELAVALTGRRLEYVQALESVARWSARVEPLLAAGIRGERNMQLLGRVRNVLGLAAAGESSRLWPAGLIALLLPLMAWGWSVSLLAPSPAAAIADDDRDERDDDDDEKEGREDDDDDDDADEKEGRGDDDDDEKEVRKEGERDDDGDKPEAREREREGEKPEAREREGDREREVRRDGDAPREGVRRDGDDAEAAVRKRIRVEQLRFLNREDEAARDGVRKEGPRDGDARKPGPKDGEARKEGPRDGERREIRIETRIDKGGEGQLAELAAMVKKLTAENERLRAELAEVRGQKRPLKEGEKRPMKEGAIKKGAIKEGAIKERAIKDGPAKESIKKFADDKEAFLKEAAQRKEAALRDKEAFLKKVGSEKEAAAAKEKDAAARKEKEAAAQKETFLNKFSSEKEAAAAKEKLGIALKEKVAAAAKEAAAREKESAAREVEAKFKRAVAEKEEAVARELKARAEAERKESELRERKIKEAQAAKERDGKRE